MAKFLRVVLFLLIASAAFAGWDNAYFRGTPNNWGTTRMEKAGRGTWKIIVRFGEGDEKGGPRFKISRNDNWDEAYPKRDYKVDRNSTYEITFKERSKEIFVQKIKHRRDNDRDNRDWKDKFEKDDNDRDDRDRHDRDDNNRNYGWDRAYFRGTPNGWGGAEMDKIGKNLWKIRVRFKRGEDGHSRFKISKNRSNWNEAYPNNDYKVEPGFYEIIFNDRTKEINVNRLSQREEDIAVDDERHGRNTSKIKTIVEFKAELK
jgi:hypothetical protein